jgi:hypothetical protein
MTPQSTDNLRFVVLRHEQIDLPHFDLMFELASGGKLRTFRSGVWPINVPSTVEALGEHRREYLEYEGEVAGGRGVVKRVTRGRLHVKASADDVLSLHLHADSGDMMRLVFVRRSGVRWMVRPVGASESRAAD